MINMTWNKGHNAEYKSIYDVHKFKYNRMKEVLILSRNNLIAKRVRSWTDKDIEMFNAFVMALYLTGGRISEVLSIRASDILISEDGEWLEIIVPTKKLKKEEKDFRIIPIYLKDLEYRFAIEPLLDWYNYVVDVITRNNESENTKLFPFNRFLGYKVCIRCGFNPHFLRKIFITQKATIYNLSVPKLQKLSGHRNMENLLSYLAIDTDDVKKDLKKPKV